ncbi:MAG: iron ABC transporter permease [Deltaproteobacteria bacterium]|jgi:iron complex transport system permease protein|nr:iron ABC transporter permease [Deltaproteobacteria bacterium]
MTTRTKLASLIIIAGLATIISPFLGADLISLSSLQTPGHPEAEVFWVLRLPRSLGAFLAGAGLSLGGMVFQALFRNPLATPFTLGVASGSAFGASVYIWLGASFLGSFGPLSASFLGAGLSMALVYLATRSQGGLSTSVMLLAGVIVNFFFSSLVLFIQYIGSATESLRITHWLMGSLVGLETPRLPDLAFIILVGASVIRFLAPEIDLLVSGEELAASRGVEVKRTKLIIFVTASIMVGAIVSLTGPIGFVGLMVPQAARWILGWSHKILTIAVFFLGGAFLAVTDLLSRVILAPAEIPIGVLTALLGGPFFLITLFSTRRKGQLL